MENIKPCIVSPAFTLVNDTLRIYGDDIACADAAVIAVPKGLIESQADVGAPDEYPLIV